MASEGQVISGTLPSVAKQMKNYLDPNYSSNVVAKFIHRSVRRLGEFDAFIRIGRDESRPYSLCRGWIYPTRRHGIQETSDVPISATTSEAVPEAASGVRLPLRRVGGSQ